MTTARERLLAIPEAEREALDLLHLGEFHRDAAWRCRGPEAQVRSGAAERRFRIARQRARAAPPLRVHCSP